MKTRFNTYDIVCMTTELQRLIGMRVNQVYDIDNRCYLIRLQRSEEKVVLLLDSGNRFHTTQFEWPKNVAPSGFTMKLRKHLKNKRLESMTQLGVDRVIDFQFGTGEAAYHVILELYDRGNILLTDHQLFILNVLRPHVEGDKFKIAVREKYPQDRAKSWGEPPSTEALQEIFMKSKPGDNLKKILNPNLEYGPAIIDHVLQENGLFGNLKVVNKPEGKGFFPERDLPALETALKLAEDMMQSARNQPSKGYIIQKKEERPNPDGEGKTFLLTNIEFHPLLFAQHKTMPFLELDSFDRAVDEFFSAMEGQKIDLKTIQLERDAMKKLQNVKVDHEKRVSKLEKSQMVDREKAELISRNQELVDHAILVIQTALAHQMSWDSIRALVKDAQDQQDPVALCIKELKLNINNLTVALSDPYQEDESLKPMLVDVDMSLTAFANARKYYDQKRYAAKKQQKTIESTSKALKSAERKTKQTLKEAHTISNISKARKSYWFEKFFWFISSDNYLVIGGRDQQQNELLVKRYMRSTDVYVHADLSGASSIIIRNNAPTMPPPKTLNEAGQAAVAYSVAWDAKVLTTAWWVHAYQVTKSAPTGEYLTTGSFMIRGKKNYLLPQHLMLGFTFMFRLEDSCIEKHIHERQPLPQAESVSDVVSESTDLEEEIPVSDDETEETSIKDEQKLPTIIEIQDQRPADPPELDPSEDSQETSEQGHKSSGQGHKSSEEDSSDDEGFPDTHVTVDHGTGKVTIQAHHRTVSEASEKNDVTEPVIPKFPPLPKSKSQKIKAQKKETHKEEKPKEGPKRGQKSKLKKIKMKYKDQDEEDKQAFLEAYQPNKEPKKVQKKNPITNKKINARSEKIPQPAPMLLEGDSEPEVEPQDLEVDAATADAESTLLRQLSGQPLADDELLFAVPVVAPYSVLHHYKYKVKLTPGTGKRGKAAKTAVQVFLKDKACTQREKDLLKAVKDEDVARNFPGKVKLSAPQLHKHKK